MESRILREGYVRFGGEGAETCRAQPGKARLPLPYYVSELLGKETIETRTSSQSKGRNGSYSQNFQQAGRELLTPDEVRMLDNRLSIILIRGEAPVIDAKFDLERHPNIKYTGDGGAAPYVHNAKCLYDAGDLDFEFTSLDETEIIDELEESDHEK